MKLKDLTEEAWNFYHDSGQLYAKYPKTTGIYELDTKGYKTIIAGSRTIKDYKILEDAMSEIEWNVSEVVSGRATGPDRLGEKWARENQISIKFFPADWAKFKNGAGPIRNEEMARYAEALVLLWDGESTGSMDMLTRASDYSLKIFVRELNNRRE